MTSHRLHSEIIVGLAALLSGCGLSVPEKDPFRPDTRLPSRESIQGNYESGLVDHITCEVARGLREAEPLSSKWFSEDWGFTTTLSITAEDQTGLSPGVSFSDPLKNVVYAFASGGNVPVAQSRSFSLGGSASVNALRTETIQFTFRNRDVIKFPCDKRPDGILIDGDLKIADFIYDKAVIAATGQTILNRADVGRPAFNTWTEEITFVSTYGASATPTWKLATISSGTSSNLVVAQRTNTNDLVVTFGPLEGKRDDKRALSLSNDAMTQHFTRVQAAAIAVSITGQSH